MSDQPTVDPDPLAEVRKERLAEVRAALERIATAPRWRRRALDPRIARVILAYIDNAERTFKEDLPWLVDQAREVERLRDISGQEP
jgi:hypothetical protein